MVAFCVAMRLYWPNKPNTQMSYGEFSYYPPYIYQYAIGWFGRDSENLNRIAPEDKARKIVRGFGGVKAVKAELKKTLKNKEYAWSAELAGYLVKAAPDDSAARQLLADAMPPATAFWSLTLYDRRMASSSRMTARKKNMINWLFPCFVVLYKYRFFKGIATKIIGVLQQITCNCRG